MDFEPNEIECCIVANRYSHLVYCLVYDIAVAQTIEVEVEVVDIVDIVVAAGAAAADNGETEIAAAEIEMLEIVELETVEMMDIVEIAGTETLNNEKKFD